MKIRLISVILILLMLIPSIISCTPTTSDVETSAPDTSAPETLPPVTDPPTQDETQPTPPPTSELDLIKDGASVFTVLRPLSATEDMLDVLLNFIDEVKRYTDVTLTMSHEGRNDPPQNDNYEILIGNTQRAETLQVASQLKYDDYFYGVVGNKIVILGGNDKATKLAVVDFLTYVVKKSAINDKNNITLDPDNNYTNHKTYSISSLSVAGIDAAPYKIVYSDDDFYGAYLTAQRLSLLIAKKSGYVIPVVEDDTAESEHEIVIGNTSRENSHKSATAYTQVCSGTKLYLHSPYSAGYEFLYNDLEEAFNTANDSFSFDASLSKSIELSSVFSWGSENMLSKSGSLRVMFSNVWDVEKDDPNAPMKLRAQQLADVYRDYAPDVLGLQEANGKVQNNIWSIMKNFGYKKAPCPAINYNSSKYKTDCVIYYNESTVNLIDSGCWMLMDGVELDFEIPNWAWRIAAYAVFEEKATGKRFCVVSIHYTWLESYAQASECRIYDAEGTIKLVSHLMNKYNLPIILGGDYNANYNSQPITKLRNNGFTDVENLANKTEKFNTHHDYPKFDQNGVPTHYYPPAGNHTSAIDHIFAYNAKSVSFGLYEVVEDWFALASTDHCPVMTDFTLK